MIQSIDGKENQKKKKVVLQLVCLHLLVTPIVGFQDWRINVIVECGYSFEQMAWTNLKIIFKISWHPFRLIFSFITNSGPKF